MTTKYPSILPMPGGIYNGLNKSHTSPCSQKSQTSKFGSRAHLNFMIRISHQASPTFINFHKLHRTKRNETKNHIQKQKIFKIPNSPFLALLSPIEVYQLFNFSINPSIQSHQLGSLQPLQMDLLCTGKGSQHVPSTKSHITKSLKVAQHTTKTSHHSA